MALSFFLADWGSVSVGGLVNTETAVPWQVDELLPDHLPGHPAVGGDPQHHPEVRLAVRRQVERAFLQPEDRAREKQQPGQSDQPQNASIFYSIAEKTQFLTFFSHFPLVCHQNIPDLFYF